MEICRNMSADPVNSANASTCPSRSFPLSCRGANLTTNFVDQVGRRAMISRSNCSVAEQILQPAAVTNVKRFPDVQPILKMHTKGSSPCGWEMSSICMLERECHAAGNRKLIISPVTFLKRIEKLEADSQIQVSNKQNIVSEPQSINAEGHCIGTAGSMKSEASESVWHKGDPVKNAEKLSKPSEVKHGEKIRGRKFKNSGVWHKGDPVKTIREPTRHFQTYAKPPEMKQIQISQRQRSKTSASVWHKGDLITNINEITEKQIYAAIAEAKQVKNPGSDIYVCLNPCTTDNSTPSCTKKRVVLEVGGQFAVEELSCKLAVSKAKTHEFVSSTGMKPDAYSLDRDMIDLFCQKHNIKITDDYIGVEDTTKTEKVIVEHASCKLEMGESLPTSMDHPGKRMKGKLGHVKKRKISGSIWCKGKPLKNHQEILRSLKRYAETLEIKQAEKTGNNACAQRIITLDVKSATSNVLASSDSEKYAVFLMDVNDAHSPGPSTGQGLYNSLATESKLILGDKPSYSWSSFEKSEAKFADKLKAKDQHNSILKLNQTIPRPKEHIHKKYTMNNHEVVKLQVSEIPNRVKTKIHKVPEKGLLLKELSHNLAVSEAEILDFLFLKGVNPDGIHSLDKDMVKMVCEEFNAKELNVYSATEEDSTKKKQVLVEQVSDRLEKWSLDLAFKDNSDHNKKFRSFFQIRKPKTSRSTWHKGEPFSAIHRNSRDSRERVEFEQKQVEKSVSDIYDEKMFNTFPEAKLAASNTDPFIEHGSPLRIAGNAPRSLDPQDSGEDLAIKDIHILGDKIGHHRPPLDQFCQQVVLPRPIFDKVSYESSNENHRFPELNISFSGAEAHAPLKINCDAEKEPAAPSVCVRTHILKAQGELAVRDLLSGLAVNEAEIFEFLLSKGIKADAGYVLDKELLNLICKEYSVVDGGSAKVGGMVKKKQVRAEQDIGRLEKRPPVFTIMGHVDHGKTTLLDAIRKSRVASSEAGGITQGIGAYNMLIPVDGKFQSCVLIDTPGHEAFTAMRACGTRVTDVAVIVVASDDGVRSQTNEAIAHAKAAGVPIVIAINKIDKDGSSPQRVMEELSLAGLVPEEWGGDVPMVQISALTGENVSDLLETVLLVAELQELKANPHGHAKGAVIEATLHRTKGPLATLIVQSGTLKQGDIVVCGEAFGKVRTISDDGGYRFNEAGPSTAIQVTGLSTLPLASDQFEVVTSLDDARNKAEAYSESLSVKRNSEKLAEGMVSLTSIASAYSYRKRLGMDLLHLNIILKVGVQGSLEAVKQALQALPQDKVMLKFLVQASGNVTSSDVDVAFASKAIIFGFNVHTLASVKCHADSKAVKIRIYRVIYELVQGVRDAMENLLEPVGEERAVGSAEVRAVFSVGSGRVAGCMVTEGKVIQGCRVQVIRKGKTIHAGIISSLRRLKETVKEVLSGLECGIGIADYTNWEVGDVVQSYIMVKKRPTLEEAPASVADALEGERLAS